MKKALITLTFPIFIVAGTLPLLFLAAIKPSPINSSSNRHWIVDQPTLIYTEDTREKLEVNTSYVLSLRINNKSIADTIQLGKLANRYISNGRLLVVSPLKTAIDVYQLNNNRYEGSLYIPKLQNKKVIAVHLLSGLLVAFCQNSFSIYSLPALNSGIAIQTQKEPPTGFYFNLDPGKFSSLTIIGAELVVLALIISILFFVFKVSTSSSSTPNSTTSISEKRTSITSNTTIAPRVNKKNDILSV